MCFGNFAARFSARGGEFLEETADRLPALVEPALLFLRRIGRRPLIGLPGPQMNCRADSKTSARRLPSKDRSRSQWRQQLRRNRNFGFGLSLERFEQRQECINRSFAVVTCRDDSDGLTMADTQRHQLDGAARICRLVAAEALHVSVERPQRCRQQCGRSRVDAVNQSDNDGFRIFHSRRAGGHRQPAGFAARGRNREDRIARGDPSGALWRTRSVGVALQQDQRCAQGRGSLQQQVHVETQQFLPCDDSVARLDVGRESFTSEAYRVDTDVDQNLCAIVGAQVHCMARFGNRDDLRVERSTNDIVRGVDRNAVPEYSTAEDRVRAVVETRAPATHWCEDLQGSIFANTHCESPDTSPNTSTQFTTHIGSTPWRVKLKQRSRESLAPSGSSRRAAGNLVTPWLPKAGTNGSKATTGPLQLPSLTRSSPSPESGDSTTTSSIMSPISKLKGSCPTEAATDSATERSTSSSIQQGFIMSTRNDSRWPSSGASSSSASTMALLQSSSSRLVKRAVRGT